MARRVLSGQTPMAVATAMGVDVKTVRKWAERFGSEGPAGLEDRSSRPHRLREPTPPEVIEQIIALRRQRWTGKQIAKETATSRATVSRVLRSARLSRMRDLEPAAPITGEILTSQVRSIDTQTRPIAFAGSVAPEWVLAEARAKLAVLIGLEG